MRQGETQLSSSGGPGENYSSYACKCGNYIRKKPGNLSNGNPAVVLVLLSPSFFLADEALMEELSEIRDAVLPCRNLLLLTEQCCIHG